MLQEQDKEQQIIKVRRRVRRHRCLQNNVGVGVDAFAFEGGGCLGCAYIGAIRAASELGVLQHVNKFSGSSVGAIAAAFLACRASAAFIESAFGSLDIKSIADRSRSFTVCVYRVLRRGGCARGAVLKERLATYLRELTGNRNITFGQIQKRYGTTLVITGTSLTRATTEYFCAETHADMSVLQALLISTAMPGLFPIQQHNGEQWSDGGILHNYPIQVFDREGKENSKTVGFKLITSDERAIQEPGQIGNGVEAGCAILRMLVDRGQRLHEHERDWRRTVAIDAGALSSTSFDLSSDEKNKLIENGYNATNDYLKKYHASSEAIDTIIV